MKELQILDDNFKGKNNSFLYFLREKSSFNNDAFRLLCAAIRTVANQEVEISRSAQKIAFIYGQALKYLLYHFDKNDDYKVTNLPENYSKMIETLSKSVEYYFKTRI